ncbi:hypothetical protein AB4298_11080 [Shewanella sp. 10N.261.52.F9]|uniref:hypothetical protein n=1 Tax=Shewanella sp. 10N.261.52.F9 TaxID=3229684 RepID=UPI00355225FC
MILFTENIVNILNEYFSQSDEYVESILLAAYGFKVQFVSFDVQCEERVFATIAGQRYEWNDAPTSAPWGALGRQLAKEAVLKSPELLSIRFESGDVLEIETAENQYESVIFNFPPKGESLVMEIF